MHPELPHLREIPETAFRLLSRYWVWICLLQIVLLALYQVSKSELVWRFDGHEGQPQTVCGLGVVFIVLAAVVGLGLIRFHRSAAPWFVPGTMAVMLLGCAGVLFQKTDCADFEKGHDFLGWHQASVEAAMRGPIQMVMTWNSRANPEIESDRPRSNDTREFIERMGLKWTIGSAWDRQDLPQGGRMYVHPP